MLCWRTLDSDDALDSNAVTKVTVYSHATPKQLRARHIRAARSRSGAAAHRAGTTTPV